MARRHAHRLLLTVVLLLGLAWAAPAAAEGSDPCAFCGDAPSVKPAGGSYSGAIIVRDSGGSVRPYGGNPGGGSCPGCRVELIIACGNGENFCPPAAFVCNDEGGGVLYFVLVIRPPDYRQIEGEVCLRPGEQPVSLGDITDEVREYVDELVPRDGEVVVQPAGGALIRVPTLVRSQMSTAPITQEFFTGSGFAVQVTAQPVRWEWTFGEGPVQTYTYPGAAYDGSDPTTSGRHVTHTYATPGTRGVQVTVVWTASYQLAGVGTVQVGEVRRPSQVEQVVVKSARSELVRG